ncbi:unnamed protein product [Linum trigynum]|uniref:F-box domain-containing protein n=1 Tax=Linum trigynum TaxID=586398 RepID=A0AAV2EHW4_9ROSI
METKIAGSGTVIGGDDRISILPDEIICRVLSFLETKYAVGTAVLSQRWRDLWTRVSSLDLDSSLVYKPLAEPRKLEPASNALERREWEFRRFANKVLAQHQNLNSLTRFRFHFVRKVHSEAGFEWEFVFGPPMEEIDVMISGHKWMRCIPESFYTLRNLKFVTLSGVMMGSINKPAFLPCVKILQLSSVKMRDVESLGRLLCGFPVLETLLLNCCYFSDKNDGVRIEVSLPWLKNLKIIDYDAIWGDWMFPIVIEAPNLEDLYVEAFAELQFKGTSPLSCLHSAHAHVDVRVESYSYLIRLLTQISNAKKMHLSGKTLSPLSAVDDVQLPVFPNLTHLIIRTSQFEDSIRVLHSLLSSASKLQLLVLDTANPSGEERMTWEDLETARTPECLLSSLEEIEIKELTIYPDVKNMIAYLLRAGAVLKKVSMHVNGNYLKRMGREDLMPLLELSKRSSACKVELIFPDDKDLLSDSDAESNTDNSNDDGSNDVDDRDDEFL